ncbi:hypothetical protein [Cognatiluteimonas telluris]|uniref:hypothetical protein n=1 Tax=Cognatiluteimonas telluris TaxID=1104775 RepID=UPI00140BBF03|nr:hypothetical protein [Lysobacter telluris]
MPKIIAIFLLGLAGCSQYAETTQATATDACERQVTDPTRTSMVTLLANPGQFEGKPIAVIGFYHESFEHSAIYLSREDFSNFITSNGFWVASKVPEPLNDHYVLLEGIFTAKSHGHLGQWQGMICGVSKAVSWGRDER